VHNHTLTCKTETIRQRQAKRDFFLKEMEKHFGPPRQMTCEEEDKFHTEIFNITRCRRKQNSK